MKTVVNFLVVGGAGFAGAVARYAVGMGCGRLFGTAFPIGTFIINIAGSFFLGWFAAFADSRFLSETTRLALAVGFTGAFTTFSTFMYESNALVVNGAGIKAIVNLLGSLLVGLLAVRLGMILGQR
jgi:fluoride exporter